MQKQRGGGFTVSGYLALALLVLAAGEALAIRHLYAHRNIEIRTTDLNLDDLKIIGPDKYGCVEPDEYYTVSAADPFEQCGAFEPPNVCCTRI